MNPRIFREYDIRGVVNRDFEVEDTYHLTKAIATYFLKEDPSLSTIVIGMDGRIHSALIKERVVNALLELGLDVLDIGTVPTPVMYFSLFNSTATAGIMITASHNPKEYNGMKICLGQMPVWGTQIQEIRRIVESKNFHADSTKRTGSIEKLNAKKRYIEWMGEKFAHLKGVPIRAVIDCGNGAAGTVLPELLKEMGWRDVSLLYEEVDGNFPNHEADPTVMKNMQSVLKELQADRSLQLGIGFDGDADRMNPMTKTGYLVPGDELLAIFSKQVLKQNPGTSVVFDIKSSQGLIELLEKWGARPCISPSGHSLIKNSMLLNNALVAGELSCHFFFKDRYFGYDDGIYAMMRLFEILSSSSKDLDALLKVFPRSVKSPEFRIPCKEEDRELIIDNVKKYFAARKCKNVITIDGVRAHLSYGWGLARISNTQPVICLRFESSSKGGLSKIKENFIEALMPFFTSQTLRKEIDAR